MKLILLHPSVNSLSANSSKFLWRIDFEPCVFDDGKKEKPGDTSRLRDPKRCRAASSSSIHRPVAALPLSFCRLAFVADSRVGGFLQARIVPRYLWISREAMAIRTFILFVLLGLTCNANAADVVYAVNAGGDQHTDVNGIRYIADPINVGTASDYGQRFTIRRAPTEDQTLYQTERWHHESFSYDIPVKSDGDYVLVLKFSEVYFNSAEQKIFNVQLNNHHMVISSLDIYDKVGHATAHDEVIPFSVQKGKLLVGRDASTFNGVLSVELLKGTADNPKICAFYLMKGKPEDVIPLPPLDLLNKAEEEEDEDDEEDSQEPEGTTPPNKSSDKDRAKRDKLKSGPPAINPYAEDNSSLILPIIVAFCAFIPTLVCLCRL